MGSVVLVTPSVRELVALLLAVCIGIKCKFTCLVRLLSSLAVMGDGGSNV